MPMRRTWVIIGVLALAAGALVMYWLIPQPAPPAPVAEAPAPEYPAHAVIGTSVEGRPIDAYTYGTGATHLAFVGGMHGGLEWDSVLLAYQLMDYFKTHPEAVPATVAVTIIPDVNPDGVYKVLGIEGRPVPSAVPAGALDAGRFNAHGVDLNRNFDCRWVATSTWKGVTHSAGTAPFSEPEARAVRNFVASTSPAAVIFFHSVGGAVYAAECGDGPPPGALDVLHAYAAAAGYPAHQTFDAYTTNGDSESWLASLGVPALTVELTTHSSTEFDKNLAGVEAVINYFK